MRDDGRSIVSSFTARADTPSVGGVGEASTVVDGHEFPQLLEDDSYSKARAGRQARNTLSKINWMP